MTHTFICDQSVILHLFQVVSLPSIIGHPLKLYRKIANTRLRNKFFSNHVVSLWNSLSQNVLKSPSVEAFKSAAHKTGAGSLGSWYGMYLTSRVIIIIDWR